MNPSASFRLNWYQMDLPPKPGDIQIRTIPGTNAYLAKSYDGSMGLFLRDVTDPLPKRRYKHLEITMHNRKLVPTRRGDKILKNCMILLADSEIRAPALYLILEGLHDQNPSGQFTAADMISVLDDVEELLRRPKTLPTIEEVAGAWGELYILRLLVQNTSNPKTQRAILSSWEGEVREKLDFRFLFAMQVLEIKTTMSSERIHHLHGIEQVTIPSGFDYGALASLCVETDEGYNCATLLDSIEDAADGTDDDKEKFTELLTKRILVRGPACCDDRFSFDLMENGLGFYDLSEVPMPGEAEGVTPIEWLSDLANATALFSSEKDTLISRITHPHQVS